jgi:toxin FitB
MTRVVLLLSGPLGQVAHPKRDVRIVAWLQALRTESTELRVPEIADYELRRELLRLGKTKSINRLNQLVRYILIPIDTETMRTAAELWASIRREGKPTASNYSG